MLVIIMPQFMIGSPLVFIVGSSSAAICSKTTVDHDDDDIGAFVAGQADGGGLCRPRLVQGGGGWRFSDIMPPAEQEQS